MAGISGRGTDDIIHDLTTDLDKITKLLHCQICTELLCEPFVLSCGHTFCYTCSHDWFKSKKTCPSCRCDGILSRKELLSPIEGHEQRRRQIEQENLLRSHVTPYPGLFKTPPIHHAGIIDDPEDNVMRCLRCHWEVEGQICLHCGFEFDDDAGDLEDLYSVESDSVLGGAEESENAYDLDDSFIDEEDYSDDHVDRGTSLLDDEALEYQSFSSQDAYAAFHQQMCPSTNSGLEDRQTIELSDSELEAPEDPEEYDHDEALESDMEVFMEDLEDDYVEQELPRRRRHAIFISDGEDD